MTNTKTFILAAAAALSLGMGTAMAQDSAFFTEQGQQWPGAKVAPGYSHDRAVFGEPQSGSADVEHSGSQPVEQAPLYGAAGTGG
jgi:hypothetical protein